MSAPNPEEVPGRSLSENKRKLDLVNIRGVKSSAGGNGGRSKVAWGEREKGKAWMEREVTRELWDGISEQEGQKVE